MRVIEPGHIYQLDHLDGVDDQMLVFVNREKGTEHEGTQTQEVLRATIDVMECLIDRTNHCDNCLRWEGNDRIVKALSEAQRQMRLALLYHEQRAMERKLEKGTMMPEKITTGKDGHFSIASPLCPGCGGTREKRYVVTNDPWTHVVCKHPFHDVIVHPPGTFPEDHDSSEGP